MRNAVIEPNGMLAGQVARELGVGVQTLHFYEREGLIPPPKRAQNGYRVYDTPVVDRVRFVRKAQSLGLSLDDVKEIFELADRGACPCGHVHAALAARLQEIDDRLRELRSFRAELAGLVRRARGVGAKSTRPSPARHRAVGTVCEIIEGASIPGPTHARSLVPLTRGCSRARGRAR